MSADVQPIWDGDLRIFALVERLEGVLNESCGTGLTVAAVVGALEIVKQRLIFGQFECEG